MRESSDLSDLVGEVTPLTPETIAAARHTVAGHLTDPTIVAEVLNMLGIGASA